MNDVQGKKQPRPGSRGKGRASVQPDQRRSDLRADLLRAAERSIASEGLRSLKARQIAAEVGCAVGQIYNVYDDLDGLILAVNARTLDELDERLETAASTDGAPSERAAALMLAQAHAYLDFANENRNRWQAVFQHRITGSRERPEWYREQQARLFSHLDRPLRTLLPELAPRERALLGRSIFSAVHGIVWLGIGEKLGHQPYQELRAQLETIVRTIVRGLQRS